MKLYKIFPALTMGTMLIISCDMKLSSSAIDSDKYLGTASTSSNAYEHNSSGLFYNPFNFNNDDFGRLILFRIKDHPIIESVELIVQDENKGAYVVIYYHDGKVENYLNPSFASDKSYVKLDVDWKIIENHNFTYVFKDTPNGLLFSLDIMIYNDQHINIKLKENQKNIRRFSMLAEVGADLYNVKRFPIIYMRNAGLVPINSAEVSITINGKIIEVSKPPIKVENEKRYRIAYALTRLPFFWNEERSAYLDGEDISDSLTVQINNTVYSLLNNDGFTEIESINHKVSGHSAKYKFSPSFPDIGSLRIGSKVFGKYTIGIDEIGGVIGGNYSVINSDSIIFIDIIPEKCWGPIGNKNWASKYHYQAELSPIMNGKFIIKSEWTIE